MPAPLPGADPQLAWLADQLWPASSRSVVGVHLGAIPTGRRVVERYLVVPRSGRARFLVPAGSRRVAVSSLLRYNALRPRRVRAFRAGLAAAVAVAGARRPLGDPLYVTVGAASPDDPAVLLAAHLARVLGVAGTPAAAVGVHPADPNYKPTLQLFDRTGLPVGYVKVGWNDATRGLVRNEAAALRRVGPRLTGGPLAVPAVVHDGDWAGHRLLVTRPLPPAVRRWRGSEPPPLAATLAVARTGPQQRVELVRSGYWAGARRRAEAARLGSDGPALAACLARLSAGGDRPVALAGWHGDWVPWNLATAGGRLHVWDWEHAGEEAPLGFDLLHWHFQVELVGRGRDAVSAAAYAETRSWAGLRALGLGLADCRWVTALYLLEMLLRTADLERAGGGWNPALYPDLLHELTRRTAALP